jgi:type IV pilus assembly protein PilB
MVGDPSRPSQDGPGTSGESRRVLLGELLVESKVITPEQLGEVLSSPREAGKKLGQVLLERGWITEAQLTQTLSLQLSVPWVSLYHIDFSRQLLNRVSREVAEKYCLIPIFIRHVKGQGETLYVAMDDPTNEVALQEVARVSGLPTKPMIASASDIRSAIRVYYGEPSASKIEVPAPLTRADPPVTAREGKGAQRIEPPPATPAAPTVPDPPRSQPAPVAARRSRPNMSAVLTEEEAPATTRSNPPTAEPQPHPKRMPSHPDTDSEPRRRIPRMVNLTLLDGTTISLPAKKKKNDSGPPEKLTARDFVSALRATAHGADASEILGDNVKWEPIVAAMLSILLRKGLIADWEFVEELRKI